MISADLHFALNACFLLGIERVLYGSWFIYPNYFKFQVRKGVFGESIKNEPLFWKSAMTLGKYIKVIQFSVIAYDVIIQCDTSNPLNVEPIQCLVGVALILIGQVLNVAVFKALGGIGVYYGSEFGYIVPRVTCFPYNVSWISDPQYWGVIFTIWGLYITLDSSKFTIPIIETCWYVCSMKFLECQRGRTIVKRIIGDDIDKSFHE
jgi:hypothetical protein